MMTSSKIMRIILVPGILLIIVGVLLMGWTLKSENEQGIIKVKLKNGKTESIAFEDLSLVPGESYEYIVKIEKHNAKKCNLEIDFVDTNKEKTLKNFMRVKIMAGDEIVCDQLLADAFESDKIVLPVDFDEGKNTELNIVYYIPVEVGNEAKGAEAVFELLLKASNE